MDEGDEEKIVTTVSSWGKGLWKQTLLMSILVQHLTESMDVCSQATCLLSEPATDRQARREKESGSSCQLPDQRAIMDLDFLRGT